MRFEFYLISFTMLIKEGLAIRRFTDEYPDVTVCESTLTDEYEYHMPAAYEFLKGHFWGIHKCTHIEGNLVIQNIHPDPAEPDMSFLESVREITGMVFMRNNSIKKVILPNLRIIRGEKSKKLSDKLHASLVLDLISEDVSGHATFPNLKVISNHSVLFRSVSPHRYLPNSIQWEELFENPKHQSLIFSGYHEGNYSCHPNCSRASFEHLPDRCWSPRPDHCQPRTRCLKKTNFECHWCYFFNIDNKMEENCCNDQCSGGCHGSKRSQCTACRSYVNNDTCVVACNEGQKRPVRNNDIKLRVGMMCANKCPENLLQQDDSCIYKCSSPSFYRADDQCLPCTDSSMCSTRECHIDEFKKSDESWSFYMTKEILENMTDCEHVVGKFHLTERSFDKNFGNITLPMLYEHLRNVKYITGDLLIDGANISLRNLTFLENLKEIRHQLTNAATAALNIFSTDLQFLGLRRLRHVYGNFEEHDNDELCYLDTLLKSGLVLRSNRADPIFEECDKMCDPQCGSFGCWGPGSTMCYICNGVRAGFNCVNRCEDQPGFYTNKTNKEYSLLLYDDGSCQRCHPLCLQNCSGPNPDHCTGGCRFFREDNKCVSNCSNGYFPDHNICIECNKNCKQRGLSQPICSGNGSHVGEGGCSFCLKFIQTDISSYQCYNNIKCPESFFPIHMPLNSIKPNDSNMTVQVCIRCPHPCSKCYGTSVNNFHCEECATGYWSQGKCVSECNSKRIRAPQNISLGDNCPYCHDQCQIGCFVADSIEHCIDCVNRRLVVTDDLEKFICVEHCPSAHNYTYKDEKSQKFYCLGDSQWNKYSQGPRGAFIRKMTLLVLIPVFAFLFMMLLAVARYFYMTNKAKSITYLKAIYSNIREPDSRVLLTKNDLPNMNRLLLIPTTNLIFNIRDKPLGTGAFGAVYKGIWKFTCDQDKISDENQTLDVAIKVIQANRGVMINDILEEAKVMASVSHKHCLRLIGVCLKYEMPCLVTSFVELGSLDKYLRKHKNSLSSYDILSWAEQIANGMAYLEMRNIIHRDLATRNVLLNNLHLVQITDFGLSQILQGTENNIVITSGQVPIRWLALETLISGIYSHKTDVWAFGVTIWEIFTFGLRPYDDLDVKEITPFLQQNYRLSQPDICSVELYILMTRCWYENSQDRPSFDDLMTTLFDYTRHSTYYLNIPNDPCLAAHKFRKQRLMSQCSYEMHQYPKYKGVYKQQSLDGTISTLVGDYQDDILDSSLRRQSSNFSWTSSKYRFTEDMEKKNYLLRQQSALSENLEENENFQESGELVDLLEPEYLEPIRK